MERDKLHGIGTKFILALIAASALYAQFQPSPPYYATFFYPWYPQWTDRAHTPPRNWFSNYLPDPEPCVFDPAAELYRSTDDRILDWQLRKMAEARIEIAIASWWGRGHKTDAAMRYILGDFMDRADNPYPNLRWAIYYELESQGDPTVEKLTEDLLYIREQFASRPAYLHIGGKPVVFVYSEGRDTADLAARWAEARRRTGFYTVLKVFPGYRTDPNQPDSWHQYAPANRIDRQNPYSWAISPGFWLDGEGVRLKRDVDEFREAVASMVAADVPWKLIQTWNEWGEGTSVEPGEAVLQTTSGVAARDPDAPWFKNRFIEVLRESLPPLERGTGARDDAPVFERAGVVNGASMQAGPIAPSQVLTIFGSRLNGEVTLNCIPARVLFASDTQINVVTPADLQPSSYAELRVGGSYPITVPTAAENPAIFGAKLTPACAGEEVTFFATGLGRVPYVVKVGEVAVTPTLSEEDGVHRVTFRIPPETAPAADVPVTLESAHAASQPGVTIAVKACDTSPTSGGR